MSMGNVFSLTSVSKVNCSSHIFLTIVCTIIVCTSPIHNFGQIASDKHLYLDVYPNPVRETAKVSLFGLYSIPTASGKLFVLDMQGKVVRDITNEYQKNSSKNWSIFTYDFSGISEGVYILSFTTKNRRVSKRVLVVR